MQLACNCNSGHSYSEGDASDIDIYFSMDFIFHFIVRPSSSQPILVCRENMSNMTKLQPMFNQTAEYCASGNFRGEKDWEAKILPNSLNRFFLNLDIICAKKRETKNTPKMVQ